MTISTLILLSSLGFLWIYLLWSRRRFYSAQLKLPGPWGLPFIGMGLQMMKPEEFLQNMEKMSRRYKTPFISWMGNKCFLYVNDPETIETVFNSPMCTNKADVYRFMATAIGDGLFTSSAHRWSKHRRLLNPAFSRRNVHNFLPIFNEEANKLLDKLMATQGQSVEIYDLLKKSVLEVSCRTTMGKQMDFQSDASAEIFDSYNGITESCVRRMLSPWLYPDIIYCYSSLHKRQQQVTAVLYKFVEALLQPTSKSAELMDRTMHHTGENAQNNDNGGFDKTQDENDMDDAHNDDIRKPNKFRTFVDHVRGHIEAGQLTWQDAIDEANVIVAATFETTSTALYLVCLCLATHSRCQDKLYKELVELFPHEGKDAFAWKNVSEQQLDRMTYTEMVINEAMRLFAPVPVVLRRASDDFPLANGVVVPRGTQIAIDIFNMQRREDLWGPCARTFDPDRHFGVSSKGHPFAFIPFTKGLRMCIGYRYALILMKVMIAKIFLNFRVRTDAKISDLAIKGNISLKLCHYPLCKLQLRKDFHMPSPPTAFPPNIADEDNRSCR